VYQTSNLSDAPQPGLGIEEGFQVAFTFVPAVFTQDVEDVSAIALEQLSLAGWVKAANEHRKIKEQTNSILLVSGRWWYVGFIEMDFYNVFFQDIRMGQNRRIYLLIL
jgi:hypothetical protein